MLILEGNDLPNVATCQAGLEPVLAGELERLNINVVFSGQRMVAFRGNEAEIFRANMALRTALNVLVPVRKFKARDYKLLYFQCRKIPWHKLFSADQTIRIDVKGQSRRFPNSQYSIHRIKDAVVDTFRKLCDGKRPSISKGDPDIHIVAYIHENEVTIYLDSSGQPLFKRGYRLEHGEAPLKEDLAAGILLLSGWRGDRPLLDPMCGSGTFLFEATTLACQIPPNLNRYFSYMNWTGYSGQIHEEEQTILRGQIRPCPIKITGIEKDPETFQVLQEICKRHFESSSIVIENQDFRKSGTSFRDHFVVTNPPYGERLKMNDLDALYSDMGVFFKDQCQGSKVSVFTAYLEGPRLFGLKAGIKRKLYNGSLPARLLVYDIE